MKKILRIFALAFVLALLPVAFHGDDQAPFWGMGFGIQAGCAQTPSGDGLDCDHAILKKCPRKSPEGKWGYEEPAPRGRW